MVNKWADRCLLPKPLTMKQFNPEKSSARSIILTIIFTALIINSCRKESNPAQPTASDPAISQAKAWYEDKYLASTNANTLAAARTSLSINRSVITRPAINRSTRFEFSQTIKPDWSHAASYIRLKKNVVEVPVDPASNFNLQLKNGLTGKINFSKKYSRTSFLLLNDGKKYTAYIMMILADSAYIGNDLKKLSHNNYRHHDPEFAGAVLYFTPKGQYVNGFTYRNGQLVLSAATTPSIGKASQNIKTRAAQLKREDLSCTDWYADYYIDNVLVDSQYLGTTCDGSMPPGSSSGSDDASLSQAGTLIEEGFPQPGDPSVFGLNNSNYIIPDGNFDAFLLYVQTQGGASISPPIDEGIIVNGTFYPGQLTYIFTIDADNNQQNIAIYFSPDENSDQFDLGMEYNVGTGASNPMGDITIETGDGEMDFGGPIDYLPASPIISPSSAGGGGGTVSGSGSVVTQTITSVDVANSVYVDDGRGGIDPNKYINCFNDGKTASGYKLTIYVAQPVPGSNDQWSSNIGAPIGGVPGAETFITPGGNLLNVGHTFVAFEKDNTDGTSVIQVMGFYPGPGLSTQPKGIIKDDSGHPYNVSYTANVSATNFNASLTGVVLDNGTSNYVLTNLFGRERNCTDAALSWMSDAGIGLPVASRGAFTNTPGDFGQALRNVSGVSTASGTAPQGHGPC